MEIYVEGSAERHFKPDEVRMNFTFRKTANTYQKALENGCGDVEKFIEFVETLGFDKKDCRTKSFSVRENSVYDERTRSYKNEGYIFTQEMSLVYNYDVKKFAEVLEELSNEKNSPSCNIIFGLKDRRKAERALYEACVKDAKEQADTIAKASGLTLVKCEKISCDNINDPFESRTNFEGAKLMAKQGCSSARDSIQNTFVPEDIIVSNSLYAVWIAE